MKIILVDDNEDNNYYHKIMMTKAGYNLDDILVFKDANKALNYIRNIAIKGDKIADVILLDINMPGINGWEFLKIFKEIEFKTKLPKIYMVSNSRHPDDIKRADEEILISGILEKHLDVDFFKSLKA